MRGIFLLRKLWSTSPPSGSYQLLQTGQHKYGKFDSIYTSWQKLLARFSLEANQLEDTDGHSRRLGGSNYWILWTVNNENEKHPSAKNKTTFNLDGVGRASSRCLPLLSQFSARRRPWRCSCWMLRAGGNLELHPPLSRATRFNLTNDPVPSECNWVYLGNSFYRGWKKHPSIWKQKPSKNT